VLLSDEQRKQVAGLIFRTLGSSGAAIDLFGHAAVAALAPNLNNYWTAVALLDFVLNEPTPNRFVRVVRMVDPAESLVEVHMLIAALNRGEIAWKGTSGHDLWVPAEWPFADRDDLRAVLCDVATGTGPASMVIEAPAGHGKRTMCCYIEGCAKQHNVPVVVEQLRRFGDPGALDSLEMQLRLKLPRRPGARGSVHHEPERRAVVFARELARDAAMAQAPLWFVVNVQEPVLDDGVLRFVDELLGMVHADDMVAKRLRVTVLTDDFTALGLTNRPAARHVLPEIAEPEITRWLEAVAPGKDKRLYELFAAVVLEDVTSRQPSPGIRLRWLAQQCVLAHRQLMAVA
jgi:hypothetical protein